MSSETGHQLQTSGSQRGVTTTADEKNGAMSSETGNQAQQAQTTAPVAHSANLLRTGLGVLLFVAWGILTTLWVASIVHSVANGHITAIVTAAGTLALLALLCAMEGLEVSVIDRWQALWPGHPPSYLAAWLAARQLFVALVVTAATLLANLSVIVVPGTAVQITNSFVLSVFDLTWTTLTVLWFAQIFPKQLGATNPDRYLSALQRLLFPIVELVRRLGVSQPGEWTATVVEKWLDWPASPGEAHGLSLASIWRQLRKRHQSKAHAVAGTRQEGS
jgi:hypothetical protein